jgi:hypothetical protein
VCYHANRAIYSAIMEGHLGQGGFEAGVARLAPRLVDATLDLHRGVMNAFLPSAIKFHYQFNLRELSAITQGLCRMRPEQFQERGAAVRLWVHECERVLCDRLVSDADAAKFGELRANATRKHFDDLQQVCLLLLERWFCFRVCSFLRRHCAGSRGGAPAAVRQLHNDRHGGAARVRGRAGLRGPARHAGRQAGRVQRVQRRHGPGVISAGAASLMLLAYCCMSYT